jgi:hypothetical protein
MVFENLKKVKIEGILKDDVLRIDFTPDASKAMALIGNTRYLAKLGICLVMIVD